MRVQLHTVFNCAITWPMTEPAPERTYEAALRQAGVRITRQRRLVLRLLAEASDHPDAMELHRRAAAEDASVSLTTVYRTLKILEEKGEIHRHAFEGGRARFEPADAAHHDHLIDVDTGQVIEFRSDKIEALQREIARGLGYEIVRHRLELYGRKRGRR
jgi:Fur family transcriptional regulator, ferric uptake regulator